MGTKYKFYCLKNPVTNEIRYIGLTKRSLEKRLIEHLSNFKNIENTHKTKWIKSLLKKNIVPTIHLIEEKICSFEEAIKIEKDLINLYNLNDRLVNSINIKIHENTLNNLKSMSINKQKRIVLTDLSCVKLKEFSSLKEVSVFFNLSIGFISSVLTGRKKTIKNKYRLFYYDSYNEKECPILISKKSNNFKKSIIREKARQSIINRQKLVCSIDTEKNISVFESINNAARYYNIQQSNISKVLKGLRNHTNNLIFKYFEDIVESI